MFHRMKGQTVSSLAGGAIALVVLVVVIAVGAQILGTIQDTQTVNTTEHNTTAEGLKAMDEFANWFTIIVLVIIAVVIIGLLLRGFGSISRGV